MFEQALLAGSTTIEASKLNRQPSYSSSSSGPVTSSALENTKQRLIAAGASSEMASMYVERLAKAQVIAGAETGNYGGGMGGVSEALGISSGGTDGGFMNAEGYTGSSDRWSLSGPARREPLKSLYELRAGSIIPGVLVSGINSDLPGQIIAHTSENVYDTATGMNLVIPQGTRLVGQYGSDVKYGQKRVLIVWQRLLFPDGRALDLGEMPGADGAGYSGFKDLVKTNFWKTIGSAFLMTGVIAGVNLSQDNDSNDNNRSDRDRDRASDALSEALGQTLGQTLSQIIQRNLNVSPTIIIRPGYRFNIVVTKDIPFMTPYYHGGHY